ncbi:NADH dehydrogenase, alpha subcomplex, subunit 6 [Moesziomyces antarcticus]|uniref:NADH dehydrogenase, alpha subcomplex, subunit 6 n=2 Tax=Pseudozyma antarctica TaxID=84753 RepID=A0A081CEG5_PSEA2|nr:NADH dehydrogenase, alpha subcomplex, subunit 6 [Moesziomyces antarcticus]GAK65061.1 NADH dehydrogenase, alpha subcomplex, subunit 6 [Moesziomyces antarcticus]SPO45947.1 probable NADH2 dehydrogenase (ubiquinone) [Moesziomyces antarcticus]
MTTIPSRLAQTTYISRSIEEARRRSTALYRNFYRSAPEICALYALDVPPSTLRAKFRTQFEKNKAIKDVAVLDVMLLKAQQEYQETMNGWKQVPHIMKWFADEEAPARPEGFLEKFYASRDEGRGPVGTGI